MRLTRLGERARMLASAPTNRAGRRRLSRTGRAAVPPGPRSVLRGAARFGLVYAGLYCATNSQMVMPLLGGGLTAPRGDNAWSRLTALGPVREWVAERVFRAPVDDRFAGGDNRYAWAGGICWLTAAAVATPVWSVLDRSRVGHDAVQPWILAAVRMCLAGQMFYYGAAKVIPLQFRTPLARMVEPLGNLGGMDLLWAHTGYSVPYQVLLGCAEITGGALLTLPRTATLGALLSALELSQVLILNLTFDVPVKLHTAHLLLLCAVLLGPDAGRLAAFFLSGRSVRVPPGPELFRTAPANRVAAVAQVLAGLCMLGAQLHNDRRAWDQFGGGRERPALYGIWEVAEFSADGEDRPPRTDDARRWKRVVYDVGDLVSVQRMDDSVETFLGTHEPDGRSITLRRMSDPQWAATLALEHPAEDELTLDGEIDGARLRLRLARFDHDRLPLLAGRFRWVQERSSLR